MLCLIPGGGKQITPLRLPGDPAIFSLEKGKESSQQASSTKVRTGVKPQRKLEIDPATPCEAIPDLAADNPCVEANSTRNHSQGDGATKTVYFLQRASSAHCGVLNYAEPLGSFFHQC
jgi:hypothetical protein